MQNRVLIPHRGNKVRPARKARRQCLRIFVSACALVSLAGCHRKVVVVAAPPPPPVEMVSVPPPTHPSEPMPEEPVIASPTLPLPVPPVRRPQPPRRRPTPVPPTQTAVVAPPPMDLGSLTTGGESTNTALRQQTDDLLKAQTRRLNAIPTSIIALHTEQIEQARLFLKQANDAWTKLDIEGARTLATKAKVVLDEVLE
ncbi:hypothetical protein [Terriglobus roseus]|uniref:Uncharacterized protein n=1 Tax=Terriglobus roseus TaxID=392734 RepID=A0A1H4SQB7_9BACT|nr:hypothetical protein [Terriglobus roseus]SEC46326.1 hypothetical protein SAMN05443244_3521 [Terriglobus roseus]